MNSKLEITKREYKNFVILEIYGEFVVHTLPLFKNLIKKLLENKKINLTLDFLGITHVDSSGIGTLININKIMKKQERYFCLFNFAEDLFDLLETSNLHQVIKIFPSEKDFQDGVDLLETSTEKIAWS